MSLVADLNIYISLSAVPLPDERVSKQKNVVITIFVDIIHGYSIGIADLRGNRFLEKTQISQAHWLGISDFPRQ